MSTTSELLTQLNALLRLTNTEIMIAETRRAQATTPAIERELVDRPRLAAMIADHLEARAARRTLDRLEVAHTATIEWLMTRLAEVAVGGPVALRPTPLQSAVGFGRRL